MNGDNKARIYFRSKWTRDEANWIQIGVWLARHKDGFLEEHRTCSSAFNSITNREILINVRAL